MNFTPQIIKVSRYSDRMRSIFHELQSYGKSPYVQSGRRAFANDKSSDTYIHPYGFASLHYAIENTLGNLKNKRVLEIAGSWGPYMHYLENVHKAEVYGIDKAPLPVEHAVICGGMKFMIADAAYLPFKENAFDAVISSRFLDGFHLRYITGANDISPLTINVLSEAKRVLKPGGIFFSYKENILPSILSQFKPSDWLRIIMADDRYETLGNIDVLVKTS